LALKISSQHIDLNGFEVGWRALLRTAYGAASRSPVYTVAKWAESRMTDRTRTMIISLYEILSYSGIAWTDNRRWTINDAAIVNRPSSIVYRQSWEVRSAVVV
jgi:hypothetical protein